MASEQTFNINFVQEVENYPCLYNYKLPEYVKKDVTDKAWNEIGKKFNLTAAECKEKWRNIRNVFVRNLKAPKSGAGAKKRPYYLNDVMQFTLPFIKLPTASVSGNLPRPPIEDNEICETEEDSETISNFTHHNFLNDAPSPSSQYLSEPTSSPQSQPPPTPSPQSPPPTPSPQSRPLPTPSPQSQPLPSFSPQYSSTSSSTKKKPCKYTVEEGILDYFKAKLAKKEKYEDISQNPKKMFLLSLLPDLEGFSDPQFRKFKKGVMQLIDDILEQNPTSADENQSSQTLTLYYEALGQDLGTPPGENNVQ